MTTRRRIRRSKQRRGANIRGIIRKARLDGFNPVGAWYSPDGTGGGSLEIEFTFDEALFEAGERAARDEEIARRLLRKE